MLLGRGDFCCQKNVTSLRTFSRSRIKPKVIPHGGVDSMMFSVGVGQMIYEDSNRSSEFQFLFKKTPIRQL